MENAKAYYLEKNKPTICNWLSDNITAIFLFINPVLHSHFQSIIFHDKIYVLYLTGVANKLKYSLGKMTLYVNVHPI